MQRFYRDNFVALVMIPKPVIARIPENDMANLGQPAVAMEIASPSAHNDSKCEDITVCYGWIFGILPDTHPRNPLSFRHNTPYRKDIGG